MLNEKEQVLFEYKEIGCVPKTNELVVCLFPPDLPETQLALAFKHQSVLDQVAEGGLVPFSAGNIDHVVRFIQEWLPEYINEALVAQESEGGEDGFSILHTVEKSQSIKIYCSTKLPFPFYRKAVTVFRRVR